VCVCVCARAYLDFVFISLVFCIIREKKSDLLCRRNVERIERDEAEKLRFDYWCVCCCNCCFVKRARKTTGKRMTYTKSSSFVHQSVQLSQFCFFFVQSDFLSREGHISTFVTHAQWDGQKTTLGPGRWAIKN
jgi:hypothetical protein